MESISRLCHRLLPVLSQILQYAVDATSTAEGSSASGEVEEITRMLNDLKSIQETSASIKDVEVDAEKAVCGGSLPVPQWPAKLQKLARRAADLLGLYEYEVVAQQVRDQEAQTASQATTVAGKRKLGELELDQVHDSRYRLSSPASPFMDHSFRREFARVLSMFRKDIFRKARFMEVYIPPKDDKEITDDEEIVNLSDDDAETSTRDAPVDEAIVGRENNLQELIGWLLVDDVREYDAEGNNAHTPVIALVGMGGVGKTTLARHVFNDPEICKHFPRRGWVCVCDDIDLARITRRTVRALNDSMAQGSKDEELISLQRRLKDAAQENKFLLVLDDLWNEDAQSWENFYSCLRTGAKGSKIIITTRSTTVANITKAVKNIDVGFLSNKDAWTLFRTLAFQNPVGRENEHPSLVTIGQKITEKCRGLPLAIRVLASYLRREDKAEDVWNDVLKSNLWEPHMRQVSHKIFQPLVSSYLRLPASLKPCFLVFSLFPQNHEIDIQELIELWIAHELVEDNNEDIAMRDIQILLSRSFFLRKSARCITMHDMMHDLARFISTDKTFRYITKDDVRSKLLVIPSDVQHVLIYSSGDIDVWLFKANVRTLLVRSPQKFMLTLKLYDEAKLQALRALAYREPSYVKKTCFLQFCLKSSKNLRLLDIELSALTQEEADAICKLYNLRILKLVLMGDYSLNFPSLDSLGNLRRLTCLKLSGLGIKYLPCSVSCLTDLRKLELSFTDIRDFPEVICQLIFLEKLDLHGSNVRNLPESISNLNALRLLDLSHCSILHQLPKNLVKLTNLTKLDLSYTPNNCYFPVGFKRLERLHELPIFRVSQKESAAGHAGIEELKNLVGICGRLLIERLDNVDGNEDAIQAELMNKKHVQNLSLQWGNLSWDDYCQATAVTSTEDEQVLEGLRPHTNLETLLVFGWRGGKLASWLGDESFVNLRSLSFRNIPACTSLWPLHRLPSLTSLNICRMSSLTHVAPSWFLNTIPSTRANCFLVLEKLVVRECQRLVALTEDTSTETSVSCSDLLPSLKTLKLHTCDFFMCLPFHQLPVLESLFVKRCRNVMLPDARNLPSAYKHFRIVNCPRLESQINQLSQTETKVLGCPRLEDQINPLSSTEEEETSGNEGGRSRGNWAMPMKKLTFPTPAEMHHVKKYVSEGRRMIEFLIRDTEGLLPKRDRWAAAILDNLKVLSSRPESFMDAYIELAEPEGKIFQGSGSRPGQPLETTSALWSIPEAAALMLDLSCQFVHLVLSKMGHNTVPVDMRLPGGKLTTTKGTVNSAGVLCEKLDGLIQLLSCDAATTPSVCHLAHAQDEDNYEAEEENAVLVIALLGTTGTAALALLAYYHPIVNDYFDMKGWITAPADFDLVALTREALGSFLFNKLLQGKEKERIFGPTTTTEHLDAAQILLMDAVKGKRFLLVIEGVLNRNYEAWDRFQSPLTCGAPGSKILLTTTDPSASKVPRDVTIITLLPTQEEAAATAKIKLAPHSSGATALLPSLTYKTKPMPKFRKAHQLDPVGAINEPHLWSEKFRSETTAFLPSSTLQARAPAEQLATIEEEVRQFMEKATGCSQLLFGRKGKLLSLKGLYKLFINT